MNGWLVFESAQSFPDPSRPPPLRAPANRTAALENEPLAIFDHHKLPACCACASEHCSLRCLNHSNRYVARVIAGFKARARALSLLCPKPRSQHLSPLRAQEDRARAWAGLPGPTHHSGSCCSKTERLSPRGHELLLLLEYDEE
jgi:hypothetical protein